MARPTGDNQPDINKFIEATFETPLDTKRHDVPERHAFGEAFLAPSDLDVAPVGPAPQSASAGTSEKFARADHMHEYAGGGGSGGGVTVHGQLTGLGADDHPQYTLTAEAQAIADASVNTHAAAADPHAQYLTAAEGDALFLTPAEGNAAYDAIGVAAAGDSAHAAAANPHPGYLTPSEIVAGTNVVLDKVTTPGSVIIGATPGGSGVTDHGLLTGLGDDDHPQYLTDARGDALFLKPTEIVAGAGIGAAVAGGVVTISVPQLSRYPRGVMGYAAASVGAATAMTNGQKIRVWTINALALKVGRLYKASWGLRALTGPAGSTCLFTRDYVANPGTATINFNLDHYLVTAAIWTGGTHYQLFVVSADAIVDIGINITSSAGAITIWPDMHHFVVEDIGPNPANPPT